MAIGNSQLLSVVLPVFDEEQSVPPLLERLTTLPGELPELELEVIFVDDASTDGTGSLLKAACRERGWMRYYRLARNSGSHVAILAGLTQARGDAAVFLAADLQDPPDLIPELARRWRDGSRIVWAVRGKREGLSLPDRATAGLFYWLMNRFSSVRLPPTGTDFALLDRSVVDALLASVGRNPNIIAEIARLGFAQTEVPYVKRRRELGHSKWTLGAKVKASLDAMVGFSHVPMRVMTWVGISVTALAFIYGLVIIGLRLVVSQPVQGWTSTMVVLLALGGLQMMMLGLLGEYLWRNLEESRRRPLFFIEESSEPEPVASAAADGDLAAGG